MTADQIYGRRAVREALRGRREVLELWATERALGAEPWLNDNGGPRVQVKLERDHPGEIRDYYGRYLAYVMVKKDGSWVNYNVECVRYGFSPYFVKYGRSRRFHREFVEAQKRAQADQLGIWADGKMHYDDYPERLKWWGEREGHGGGGQDQ